MSSETIFVPLLNEGVDVWAPTQAEKLPDGRFRLTGAIPDDQEWPFAPGSIVEVGERVFSSGAKGLVAIRNSN